MFPWLYYYNTIILFNIIIPEDKIIIQHLLFIYLFIIIKIVLYAPADGDMTR